MKSEVEIVDGKIYKEEDTLGRQLCFFLFSSTVVLFVFEFRVQKQEQCSFQLRECLQLADDLVLRCLSYLPSQEGFVHDRVHLVEVKHQVQLAHIVEVLVQHLDF